MTLQNHVGRKNFSTGKLLLLKTTNSETYPTVTLAALVSKVSKIENY